MSDFILSESLLDNCARRAGDYDRDNRFFFEDLEELRAAKYLLAAVPREFGGLGRVGADTAKPGGKHDAPCLCCGGYRTRNSHWIISGGAADQRLLFLRYRPNYR